MRRSLSIFRAVGVRVLVYGAICLTVGWWITGFRVLPDRRPVRQQTSREPSAAEPGWPQFRGPSYDAHASEMDLADSWPAEGPPVLWSREIGRGYSGLIAVGDRLYTQTQSLTEQKVVALDADTGQTVWEHAYDWPYDPGGMYPGPRATPTWHAGRLYYATPDGVAGCLHAADGRPLWSVNLNRQFGGRGTEFGYACSPLVEAGLVILPVGGQTAAVVALRAETGTTAWASGDMPASYCTAMPITFRGRRQVVAFLQNDLAGFDLSTGRLLWRESYSHGYDEHAAAPLYQEPYLRVMRAFRGGSDLYMLEAAPPEKQTPEAADCRLRLLGQGAKMSNDVASSVLVDGCVYGFDLREMQTNRHRPSRGEFRCIDFKTGDIRWSTDRPGQSTIVVAERKLFLFNDRGEVLLVRANPKRYEELGRAEVFRGEICWTAPSLDRGRLYLRSPTRAACLYVGWPEKMDRRLRDRAAPAATVATAPRFDPSWLVGAEREYPFELPYLGELTRWYVASLGAVAAAAFLAAGAYAALWLRYGRSARLGARGVFWLAVLVFGVAATPLGNRYGSQFVFTWPLSLFAVHQLALAILSWSGQPGRGTAAAWLRIASLLLLILACLSYYDLTRQLSLAPAWYFLLTFVAAWPLAIPAARRLLRPGPLWADVLWLVLSFSLYFWTAGGLMLWRGAVAR